jgi:hypothetical protein
MGALSTLSLKKNRLLTAEAGKILSDMLAANTVLKELDLSSNCLAEDSDDKPDMSGIMALTAAIPDMRALLVLSLNSNSLGAGGGKALAEGLRGNSVIEELHIADNKLTGYGGDMPGVVAIADVIPGMGALSVTNVMGNEIGKKQRAKLQEIMRAKPSIVSLCGISDGATGADLSGLNMGADGAAILASELAPAR